jgi:translation initiation factor 2-alpha kinase 4
VCSTTDGSGEFFQKEITSSSNKRGVFVYGFIDLFTGSGESWNWGLGIDEKGGMNFSMQPHTVEGSKLGFEAPEKQPDKNAKPLKMQDTKKGLLPSPTAKLDTLEEETEDSNKSVSSTDSSRSLEEELVRSGTVDENDVSIVGTNCVCVCVFDDWMHDFIKLSFLDVSLDLVSNDVSWVYFAYFLCTWVLPVFL